VKAVWGVADRGRFRRWRLDWRWLRWRLGGGTLGSAFSLRGFGLVNHHGVHAGDGGLGNVLLGDRHFAARLAVKIDARAAGGEGDLVRPSPTVAPEHAVAFTAEQDAALDKVDMNTV